MINFQQRGWLVFEIDNIGRVVGFTDEMKKIFREIALQIRSFHKAGAYCGDVRRTVEIDPTILE